MIGDRIKERRDQLGWSQDELAEKMGYKYRSAINKIEKGVNNVSQTKIVRFANVLGVSVNWLLELEDDPVKPEPSNIFPLSMQPIPILGSIACGEPIWAEEEHGEFVMTDNMKADFGLYAKGDSMIGARIHDGDLVLCKKQERVDDGQIAVVRIGDEATLKRFYYYPENDLVILKAENPAYKDQIYQGEAISQIHVIGKAVGVQFPI